MEGGTAPASATLKFQRPTAAMHMGFVSERYCARGDHCKLYDAVSGRSQKLGLYHEGQICDRCKMAMVDEDLEVLESTHSVSYEPVSHKENPRRARLVAAKRNLVAQLLARRGDFWEAVMHVRSRWQLDPAPTRLPPDSEGILRPPQTPAQQPPGPSAFILPSNRVQVYIVNPGDQQQYTARPYDRGTWESELYDVLLRSVPEMYLQAKPPPYTGGPCPPERLLPWLRFAAACVLYDPPLEQAPAFADYGGLPLLPGDETADESIPGVLIEHNLREGEVDLRVHNDINYEISEKVWELRSKLGEGDFEGAMSIVRSRYHNELEERKGLLKSGWYKLEAETDHPRYYVPFDPTEDTKKDVNHVVKAINEKQGPAQKAGRKPQDDLLPVMCAALLEKAAWSPELLADQLRISAKRVRELAKEGQALF
jgi:hypothetical protein